MCTTHRTCLNGPVFSLQCFWKHTPFSSGQPALKIIPIFSLVAAAAKYPLFRPPGSSQFFPFSEHLLSLTRPREVRILRQKSQKASLRLVAGLPFLTDFLSVLNQSDSQTGSIVPRDSSPPDFSVSATKPFCPTITSSLQSMLVPSLSFLSISVFLYPRFLNRRCLSHPRRGPHPAAPGHFYFRLSEEKITILPLK